MFRKAYPDFLFNCAFDSLFNDWRITVSKDEKSIELYWADSKFLPQEKLADKADISRQMMNDIEGRRRWLTKKTLVKLANALEVDVYKLFLPSANENETTKGIYDYITKEVVLQIKDAVDKTLDKF